MPKKSVLIFFIFFLTACSQAPTIYPRSIIPLNDLNSMVANADLVLTRSDIAWKTRDPQDFKAAYSESAIHHYTTFNTYVTGVDEIIHMEKDLKILFPNMAGKLIQYFLTRGEVLAVTELSGLNLQGYSFTETMPLNEIDLYDFRPLDLLITKWTLFYGAPATKKDKVLSDDRTNEIQSMLEAYSRTWSSHDIQKVLAIYDDQAKRSDLLFQENQTGKEAIKKYVETFFQWYPQVKFDLLLAFGDEGGDTPVTGGIYKIHTIGLDNEPCEIREAILITTNGAKIESETLYYDPESLITCGWAK